MNSRERPGARCPARPAAPVHPQVAGILMLLGLALCTAVALAPLWWPSEGRVAPSATTPAVPTSPSAVSSRPADPAREETLRGLEVLRRWDARRATAYAESDLGSLRALYTPRSEAGRRDLALLQRYAAQGLVVEGVTPQIRSVEVGSSQPDRLRVRVEERYPQVVVRPRTDGAERGRRAGGELRFQDRVVVLQRAPGGWRVVSAVRG